MLVLLRSLGGPGSREELKSSEIGSVMSWPGCVDQKIHADIPHLFNTLHTPPHLLHAFMPATRALEDMTVGQTGFIAGSHKLDTCGTLQYCSNQHQLSSLYEDYVMMIIAVVP